jgi:transglutaminase-like putative cysteine protease
MILDVEHHLEFTYGGFISESSMELRVEPLTNIHQTVRSFYIAVGPVAKVFRYTNWHGSSVHYFNISDYHNKIKVISRSVVETHPKHPPLIAAADYVQGDPVVGPLLDFITFDSLVVRSEALSLFASVVSGETLGELVQAASDAISARLEYRPEITNVSTTIDEVLSHGYGVCQDFAHLMLAVLRYHGVPCRYVSGYLHVDAAKDRPSESHAWIEFYSPSLGWCGYDPTHRCVPDERHVMVAVGRDYHDVAPNRGIYVGNAAERLRVAVVTKVVDEKSWFEIREEIGRLEVPVYAELPPPPRLTNEYSAIAAQQQQQQQQQ